MTTYTKITDNCLLYAGRADCARDPAAPGHVIIGNGGAAVEACRGLREGGYDGPIDVYAAGAWPVYNPMLTSYYAAGKAPWALLFPYGEGNIFEKYGATLHANLPVTKLAANARTITLADGSTRAFDKCLIASGASPVVPPLPGLDSPRVFTMRTVEDAIAVKEAMEKKPQRALVVGASMVGIKLVEMFWKAHVPVTLVDMADRIFPLAAHPDTSARIEARLEEMGVALKFSAALERLEEMGECCRAWFKGEEQPLEADIVLMCVGVRANLAYVDRAEIDCQQGVLVDCRMRASHEGEALEHIYAAGDCAQGTNLLTGERQIIGLWASARNQGYTAGRNMAKQDAGGCAREYAGEILHNITHFMGMDFVGMGDPAAIDYCECREEDGGFCQIFYKDGQVCGGNFIDVYTEAGLFKNSITKRLVRGQLPADHAIAPLQNFLLRRIVQPEHRR